MTPKNRTVQILRDDRGATLVEYIILVGFLAVLSVGVWQLFGTNVRTKLTNQNTALGAITDNPGN